MFKTSTIKSTVAGMLLLFSSSFTLAQTLRTVPATYSDTVPVNYVRIWEVVKPITDPNSITTATPVQEARMTTQYIDGLGRPIQTVTKAETPLGMDMVSTVEYDEFGRELFKYLPFAANSAGSNTSISDGMFKRNPFEQQAEFYSNSSTSPIKGQGETYFYGQTQFEASPLNRVTKTLAPGNSWIGANKGVEMQYLINAVSDSVRIWDVTSAISTAPTSDSTYLPGELYKKVTIDENGNQVVEYTDKEGKVILKKVQLSSTPGTAHVGWLCTYYVYDDLGSLRFVLQPKAVEALLVQGNWTIGATIRDELCFYYGYDSRNRMVVKKVPGAAEVYMVYDKRDRLVMTQDGKMRAGTAKWLVTLYDELNRPVKTGLWTDANSRTYHETQAAGASNYYYPFTASTTPGTGFELLTETGYDDYINLPTGAPSGSLDNTYITSTNFFTTYDAAPDYAQELSQSTQTKGMVTWTKVNVLGTSTFLYAVNIYDKKGRLIQIKSKNYSDGTDIITTQYDFSGKILRNHVAHQKSGINAAIYQVLTKNFYDAAGRLTEVKKKVGSQNEVTTAKNSYDELGQLKIKGLGTDPNNASNSLESLAYDYNIRGWMLGMNRDYVKDGNSTSKFGFDLGYDKNGVIGSYTPLYNGNIAGIVWKSAGDLQKRKYDFSYDAVNRLTGADFNQWVSGTGTAALFDNSAGIDYSVFNLSYDANGNIKSQNQMGWKLTGSSAIDELAYTYTANSNKLLAVTESTANGTTDHKLGDFTDRNRTQDDYLYDVNGNLASDKNKSITAISYNHLNLPETITTSKGTIDYTYDASGNKLKKVVNETDKPSKTTLYLYGIYEDDVLQFLPMEEGRIRPLRDASGSITSFVYDYFVKDHLGNVRMVLTEEQQTNYYPAATLEGSKSTGDKSMLNWEKEFFTADNTKITPTSSIPNWTSSLDYPNNNGNPPANSIASGSYPSDYTVNDAATSANMYKLNATQNKTGLGFVIKVMAGDRMDIFGKSYFSSTATFDNSNSSKMALTDIFNAFLGTMNNVAAAKGISEQNMETLNSSSYAVPTSFIRGEDSTTSTSPKAYINYILFDDQFRYVDGGFSRVGSSGTVKNHWDDETMQNILAQKNGYLYVYVSNESNIDVFFDNVQVVHKRGPLLEETHYYPFGLTMQGISSKAINFGNPENKKNKFQNQEYNDALDVNYYEFKYRNHDPQIGRFIQIDPLADKYAYNSTYAFSENRVTSSVEIEGLESKDLYNELGPVREQRAKSGMPVPQSYGEKVLEANLALLGALATGALSMIIPGAVVVEKTIENGSKEELPSASVKGDKKVPNPNGKKGGEAHQKTVDKAEKDLKDEGYDVVKREVKVETPGGTKNKRYVDVQGENTQTGEKKMVQVGKQNKNGKPVSREVKAMDDIEKATGQRPKFVPYNNVNAKTTDWEIMKY